MNNNNKTVKKTVYINEDLVKKIKLESVLEDSNFTKTLNKILESYFKEKTNAI